jgi:hypothetical protein
MINPIVQNHHDLPPAIQREGCLFRSLSMLAEIKAGKTLTVGQILQQYKWLVDAGHMDANCYVKDHAKVITSAQYYLGEPQTGRYVFRSTETGSGDFDTDEMHNAYIGHAKTENGYGHFFVVDRNRDLIWDPWWPRPKRKEWLSFRGYWV